MARVEERLAGQGRLLVRYSGTEPLLRVMLEGRDQEEIQTLGVGDRRDGARASGVGAGDAGCSTKRSAGSSTDCSAMIKLSVNVNKVATLRNSRGGARAERDRRGRASASPPARRASPCIRAPTRGTSRSTTCARSSAQLRAEAPGVEFNIEGDPRPDLLALVHEVKPDQCTLVPVREGEITSQAGWPPTRRSRRCTRPSAPAARRACASACSSIPSRPPVRWAARSAPIASSCTPSRSRARSRAGGASARQASSATSPPPTLAHSLGLGVNAGHDLDLDNLTLFRTLPHLDEVSIGHALISHALYVGLDRAVKDYLAVSWSDA